MWCTVVCAAVARSLDAGEVGEAARSAAAGEHGDEVDRLGDQRARDGHHGFLDELLHATERADGGAGVDGADAAGVACAPRLQEIEGFSPAHLTDRDAVWAKTERGADKTGSASCRDRVCQDV